ncbi:M20 family metallopeptidase [Nonomuraea helvata]|uniref:M20 family metallopeptidase n=1 Tax=Nonomuraea helvata TaxID=37484 RepID=A0ABV5SAE2_9ACTN
MTALVAASVAAVRRDLGELAELLGRLVRTHPVYGSAGQEDALALSERWLLEAGLETSRLSLDLAAARARPDFSDVAAFGGVFGDYDTTERQCVVATRWFSDDGPHLILNGHVDVEFAPNPERWSAPGGPAGGDFDGTRIWGRGASDMLGGVACYLYVLKRLAPLFPYARGSLTVHLVLDEEVGGNGTLALLLAGRYPGDAVALIAEPTGGEVCTSSRGFTQFLITCHGVAGHMAYSRRGDNALLRMAEVIMELEDLDAELRGLAGDRRRLLTYGVDGCGGDPATPADRAALVVTVARPPAMPLPDILRRLQARLDPVRARYGDPITVEPCGLDLAPGGLSSRELASALLATSAGLGLPTRPGHFPSACDARLFESFGIPAVVFGPGHLSRAHGVDEYVTIDELAGYSSVLAGTLARRWSAC